MTYAFDVETRLLASEVEEQYASELGGESAWSRPDLFGFAAGVLVDADTDEALRFGPEQAEEMLEMLRNAEVTVGYNSAAFDFGVLSAYGDVEPLRDHHVDLCSLVWEALDALPEAADGKRLKQGGLDGLCRANGLAGKTGAGMDAPALYRDGRIRELLDYCEADTRLTADLYCLACGDQLQVEPYYRDESRERVYLPRTTLSLDL